MREIATHIVTGKEASQPIRGPTECLQTLNYMLLLTKSPSKRLT